MQDSGRFTGRRAVVTGAASGIGRAVALAYAESGGNSAAVGTVLMAALPAGGALGAILVSRWPPGDQTRAILPLALASCLPLVLTGASPPVLIATALWFVAGVGQGFMVPLIATVNLLTPAHSRGRVNGLAAAGFNVGSASAFALAGFGAAVLSPALGELLHGEQRDQVRLHLLDRVRPAGERLVEAAAVARPLGAQVVPDLVPEGALEAATAAVGGADTWVLGGAFNCGKAQPGQVAAVSHGCPTSLFRGVRILNTTHEAGQR